MESLSSGADRLGDSASKGRAPVLVPYNPGDVKEDKYALWSSVTPLRKKAFDRDAEDGREGEN